MSAVGSTTYVNSNAGTLVGNLRVNDVNLGVGVPGGTGDPNDWGMCWLSALYGPFATAHSTAHIIAGNDGYWHAEAIEVPWQSDGPKLEATCVFLRDFQGLPPPAGATTTFHSATDTSAFGTTGIYPLPTFCPWTGLRGRAADRLTKLFVEVANVFSSQTRLTVATHADPITVETWCTTFPDFVWKYSGNKMANGLGTTTLLENVSTHTCSLEGIGTSTGTMSQLGAGDSVAIAVTAPGGVAQYELRNGGITTAAVANCLLMDQR